MEKKLTILLLCLICVPVSAVDVNTVSTEPNLSTAAVISCTGLIDDGLYQSIKRRSAAAIDAGANYVILKIETYGGLVKSADDISKFLILDLGKETKTVAYINTEAISAGAMISVSCQDIIMKRNTTIGDCAPIQMNSKLEGVEREKAESFIRATFQRAASANNYPPALLEAMVSRHKKVWQVKNIQTGQNEYYEDGKLPKDANAYNLDAKELIISDNEILTLTAEKAKEYGIARRVVNDIDGVINFLETKYDTEISPQIIRLEPNWSEQMVRMLNHPTLTGILFMLGMLGVYIELKTPGIGLPGLLAVICFAILFGSRYLVGLATWWEAAIFAIGIVLLMIEIFVIPGFGIAGITGTAMILIGLFAILIPNRPNELPWPKYGVDFDIFADGVMAFGFGFFGFVVLAYIIGKYLPKTGPFKGLLLEPAQGGTKLRTNATGPMQEDQKLKLGDIGVAITTLRPTGEGKFAQLIVDVVAEGEFIDKGSEIKIIEIHGNRIVVKKILNNIE